MIQSQQRPHPGACAGAAFSSGASQQASLETALQEAAGAAAQALGSAAPDLAVLFVWGYADRASAAQLLAAALPQPCHIVGCEGYGLVGADSHAGRLVDVSIADPDKPQHGVSLLLASLPGRQVTPFRASSPAPGPGAQHQAGKRITDAGKRALPGPKGRFMRSLSSCVPLLGGSMPRGQL